MLWKSIKAGGGDPSEQTERRSITLSALTGGHRPARRHRVHLRQVSPDFVVSYTLATLRPAKRGRVMASGT